MSQRDGSTGAVRNGSAFSRASALCGLASLALLLGCGDSSGPGDQTPGPIAAVKILSGQDQEGVVGTELPSPLRVEVVDSDDRPIPGQIVNFRVVQGGGSVFAGAALTNANGVAQERWTLGLYTHEEQRIEVRAVDSDTGDPIVFAIFRATPKPGPAWVMGPAIYPTRRVDSGMIFPTQPGILVQDQYQNPVSGSVVTVAISDCPGTLLGTTTATTASNGIATYSNLSITSSVTRDCTLTFTTPGPFNAASLGVTVVATGG